MSMEKEIGILDNIVYSTNDEYTILKIDSEILYLNYLKQPEV